MAIQLGMKILLILICFFAAQHDPMSPPNCNILRKILSHAEVQHYLHPELASRKTLYVTGTTARCDFEILHTGPSVVTQNYQKAVTQENMLEIVSSQKFNDSIQRIKLRYNVEGAMFVVDFNVHKSVVQSVSVVEY